MCRLSFVICCIDTSRFISIVLHEIHMMFHEVPDIVSTRGLTYEISDPDWTMVSISTK